MCESSAGCMVYSGKVKVKIRSFSKIVNFAQNRLISLCDVWYN